ncbi:MAG: hypothetical protein R3C05_26955 [Pirellulaceae bacterium]
MLDDQPSKAQEGLIGGDDSVQAGRRPESKVRFVTPTLISAVLKRSEADDQDESVKTSDDEGDDDSKTTQPKLTEAQQRRRVVEGYALTSIGSISLNTSPAEGLMPKDYAEAALSDEPVEYHSFGYVRQAIPSSVCWTAPWIAYRPLYFEDCALERCGHDHGCYEPLVSAAKFYGRIPVWPYMIGATPPSTCVYSYGQCRPGDCSPHFFVLPKRSLRGAFYQTAAATSAVFIIP